MLKIIVTFAIAIFFFVFLIGVPSLYRNAIETYGPLVDNLTK